MTVDAVRRLVADVGPAATRDRILAFLDEHGDAALHRTSVSGHLTASAFVVDPTRDATLLMHHRKLGRWLQPGGHADGDADLAAVALREATEETGIVGLRLAGGPVDLDIHEVDPPGEPPHLHLDVRFIAVAPVDARPVANNESTGLRWFALADLATHEEHGMRRLAAAARTIVT